jgi:hypothetical protein
MLSSFAPRDGVGVGPELPTAGHAFTLVLDAGEATARAGAIGGGGVMRAKPAGDFGFDLTGKVTISLEDLCDGEVVYESMALTLTAEGQLQGMGEGIVRFTRANFVETVAVTMSLSGQPDSAPPRLQLAKHGRPSDPFQWLEVVPSEPLPEGVKPTLVSASGDAVPLVPLTLANRGLPVYRPAEHLLLRFSESYRVTVDGVVDLAGNAALPQEAPGFTTNAAPALLVEGGFESAREEDLAGAKLITAGGALPVISGSKSFYVPPEEGQPSDMTSLFTLRLPVRPTDTKIRFSYRTVDVPRGAGNGLAMVFGVASVGRTVPFVGSGPPIQPKSTVDLPEGGQVMVGPVQQEVLGLPSDVTDEVFVAAYGGTATCVLPSPPQQGIIIDDVRLE